MSDSHELVNLIEHTPEMSWLRRAACRDFDIEQLDLFFVEAGRTLSKQAAATCSGCDVRVDCLLHAYRHDIAAGYFGGVSSAKRRSLSAAEAVASIGG